MITFTFDDNNESNELAAKTLHALGLKGIFFLNDCPTLKEEVEMLKSYGQIIGNHTKSHKRLSEMDEDTFKSEVLDFNDKLSELAGYKIEYFSYPWSDRWFTDKLKQTFTYIFRGLNGDLNTAENDNGDILIVPVKPNDFISLTERLKDKKNYYLQLHGIESKQERDIDFVYFFSIINFYYRYYGLEVEKDGDRHKLLASWNLWRMKLTLEKLGIPYFLFLGTALGAYRDKDFCPGDVDDIDLAVPAEYYSRVDEIEEELKHYGFDKQYHWEAEDKLAPEVAFVKWYGRVMSKVDLFFITPENGKMLWRFYKSEDAKEYITKSIDDGYFKNYSQIEFYNQLYNIPAHIEGYLKDNYGEWQTPIHRDNWSWEKDNQCKTLPA